MIVALAGLAGGRWACAQDGPRITIGQIMLEAHVKGGRPRKNTLQQKASEGRATEAEKKRLVELYEALERLEPPEGNREDWKSDTRAMLAAARGVAAGGEKAGEKLAAAVNCKSCHDRYRFGRAIPPDKAVFLKATPPEFVVIAGFVRRDSQLVIYSLKSTPVIRHEAQEIVRTVDEGGKKKEVTEKVLVPVMEQKREAVETVVSLLPSPLPARESFRVLDAAGKELEGDALWRRLVPGNLLLRQLEAEPIDAAYLKLLSKDVLILAPRARAAPRGK